MTRLVLVTGAAGALGRRLVPCLQREGWTVRCLVHRRLVPDADESVSGDLSDPSSLARAVTGAAGVVHLAGVTHARRAALYEEVNLSGTVRLLEAARREGVSRFLFASTRTVSDAGGAYSGSKLRAEAAVRGSEVASTIVRLPEVYGAGGREGVDRIVGAALRGAPIPIVGNGSDMLAPIHVDDAVAVLAAALDLDVAAGKTYTVAGESISVRGFVDACLEAFDSTSRTVGVPVRAVAVLGRLGRVLPLPVYPDQLERLRASKPRPTPEAWVELGVRPRSLSTGLGSEAV